MEREREKEEECDCDNFGSRRKKKKKKRREGERVAAEFDTRLSADGEPEPSGRVGAEDYDWGLIVARKGNI